MQYRNLSKNFSRTKFIKNYEFIQGKKLAAKNAYSKDDKDYHVTAKAASNKDSDNAV